MPPRKTPAKPTELPKTVSEAAKPPGTGFFITNAKRILVGGIWFQVIRTIEEWESGGQKYWAYVVEAPNGRHLDGFVVRFDKVEAWTV